MIETSNEKKKYSPNEFKIAFEFEASFFMEFLVILIKSPRRSNQKKYAFHHFGMSAFDPNNISCKQTVKMREKNNSGFCFCKSEYTFPIKVNFLMNFLNF